jgi:hypothetical protein
MEQLEIKPGLSALSIIAFFDRVNLVAWFAVLLCSLRVICEPQIITKVI